MARRGSGLLISLTLPCREHERLPPLICLGWQPKRRFSLLVWNVTTALRHTTRQCRFSRCQWKHA